MKHVAIFLWLMVAGLLIVFGGCTKEGPGEPGRGPSNDKDAISQMVQSDSLGEFSTSDENEIDDRGPASDDFGLAKEATAIRPLRWGRKIENITRDIDVQIIGDSVAIATLTKHISGSLVIAASYQDTGHYADTILAKPFRERVQRKIRFHRVARTRLYERNWVPVAMTLVEGNIEPESVNLFTINSIEYTFPWGKDTITDPLNTWLRFSRIISGLPVLRVRDSVQLILHVTSTDADTEHAFLRYVAVDPRRLSPFPVLGVRRLRMKLVESTWNGSAYDRTYEATFYGELGSLLSIGRFHAVVDVMSHGSLFDDAKPFSNRYWGLPYIVVWR